MEGGRERGEREVVGGKRERHRKEGKREGGKEGRKERRKEEGYT
jgi:hypothetical protein